MFTELIVGNCISNKDEAFLESCMDFWKEASFENKQYQERIVQLLM